MSSIAVLAEADLDLARGRIFYNDLDFGLGEDFFDSIYADFVSLEHRHGFHSVHFGFHRMLAKRFPYGIYYRERDEVIQVFAVLDLRRDPKWIRRELSRRH